MQRILVITAIVAGLSATPVLAADYKAGDMTVSGTWARATPGGAKVGAGYLSLKNAGKQPDRLVGASLEGAESVQIHEMSMEGGVMKMRELPKGIEIAPGAAAELKPEGNHLMFMGLKQPIKEGAPVKGTLVFERAGKVDVTFDVRPIGAKDAGHKHHH
jgi:copper(I)-binding protein